MERGVARSHLARRMVWIVLLLGIATCGCRKQLTQERVARLEPGASLSSALAELGPAAQELEVDAAGRALHLLLYASKVQDPAPERWPGGRDTQTRPDEQPSLDTAAPAVHHAREFILVFEQDRLIHRGDLSELFLQRTVLDQEAKEAIRDAVREAERETERKARAKS